MPALFFVFLSKLNVTFSGLESHIYEGGEKVDIEKLYQEYFSVVYKYILSAFCGARRPLMRF